MEFDPDAPNTWPTDAESWYQVSYTTVTISNQQVPFPPEGYYAIFGSVFDRDPHNLSLYNAASTDVSDLLASLPQWEFTGETGDNPARTWRVIWPYHPVISTFSSGGKVHNHSDNFAVFEDLSEHVQEEVPEKLDTNRDFVVFHKTLPLAIFHSNQTVRWKFANHLDRLFQERPLTPFLQPIRNNQRGLPAAPENVTRRITTALEFALQVAQGKSPPLSDSNLKKECGQRIPYIVYSKRKPVAPDLDKDFPSMSVFSRPPPLKLPLTSLRPNHDCRRLLLLRSPFLLPLLIHRRISLLPLWLLPQSYRKQLLPPISLQLLPLRLHHLSAHRTTWRLTHLIPELMPPCPQRLLDLPRTWKLRRKTPQSCPH